jgi:hypothetical protein
MTVKKYIADYVSWAEASSRTELQWLFASFARYNVCYFNKISLPRAEQFPRLVWNRNFLSHVHDKPHNRALLRTNQKQGTTP